MRHLELLKQKDNTTTKHIKLLTKTAGAYFTHEVVGRNVSRSIINELEIQNKTISIIDPFSGDGRLIVWFFEELAKSKSKLLKRNWNIHLWDISEENINLAQDAVKKIVKKIGVKAEIKAITTDSFRVAKTFFGTFDIVITNPPWETIKPDKRELAHLSQSDTEEYLANLKKFSLLITENYNHSIPSRMFSGWGINLSRVGLELSLKLLNESGILGIVMPSSVLADQVSSKLREWVFENYCCANIVSYPAEARLFAGVDQPFVTLTLKTKLNCATQLTSLSPQLNIKSTTLLNLKSDWIKKLDYCIPVSLSGRQIDILESFSMFPSVNDYIGQRDKGVWIGREVDETGIKHYFTSTDKSLPFVKGKDIDRFLFKKNGASYLGREYKSKLPKSLNYSKIVWRDVSRPTQKRRMQATLLHDNLLTGNSLNVLHNWNNNINDLYWWLGIMSSLPFEYQVRVLLSTAHISSGVVKRVKVPEITYGDSYNRIVDLVKERLSGKPVENKLEVEVASLYKLDAQSYNAMIESFSKITADEKNSLIYSFETNVK